MKSVIKTHPLWKRGLAFFAAFAMILAMVMPSVPVSRAAEATPTPLDADLLVDGDTGKDVLEKDYKGEMTFTGTLNVSKIKKQMQDTEDAILGGPAGKFITAKDVMLDPNTVQSSFEATLTLPKGLEFTDQSEGTFTGANGVFTSTSEIDKASNTATIKFLLTNPTGYDTYLKLKKAITETVDDEFTFSVSHVKFAQGARRDTPYEATGTVEGNMQAKAYADAILPVLGKQHIEKPFAFAWHAVQSQVGAYNNDASQIAAAVKHMAYVEHINLLGDIKVGDETQRKSVYRVKKDDKVAFTGTLDVSPVKAQLAKIEGLFNPGNQIPDGMIALPDYKGNFTTTLTLPEEMDFDPATKPTVTLNGENGFYNIVGDPTIEGKTITITMEVTNPVKTFKDLKNAVNGMTNELQVTVDGVKLNNKAVKGKNYTVTGTMTGGIEATATVSAGEFLKSQYFNLSWEAIQKPEGLDSTKPVGTKDITFTLRIPKPTTTTDEPSSSSSSSSSSSAKPVEPEQPSSEMPVTPKPNKKPVAPKTGDISAVIYAGSAILSTTGLAAFVLKKNKRNDK